jgi:hypothetical protein
MLSIVDLLRLLNWPVVQPENDVAVIAIVGEVWTSYGYGLIGVGGENSKGASGIETNALDLIGIDGGFLDDTASALADALPDVCGRLFLCEAATRK